MAHSTTFLTVAQASHFPPQPHCSLLLLLHPHSQCFGSVHRHLLLIIQQLPRWPLFPLCCPKILRTFLPITLKWITLSSVISISLVLSITSTRQTSALIYIYCIFIAIPMVEFLPTFYIWGSWGLKSLSDLPKVTTSNL